FELDKGRTTFFDYWSVPELQKWMNGGKYDGGALSAEQKELRAFYGRLLRSLHHPALAQGNFYPLNPANRENPTYGRFDGNRESGRWLYSFLRYDPVARQSVLVVANLHPGKTFSGVKLKLSTESVAALTLPIDTTLSGTDLLASAQPASISCPAKDLISTGFSLPDLPPLSAFYFDLSAR
ncbi:MAG: hypothetical protein NTZ01_00405, partial [Verrucomicrobia bacterium]|nr:hypothetical protein [Verrucomicrobiota bacterium]